MESIKSIVTYPRILKKRIDEILWSEVWHDTINEIDWLKGISLSPGRFAVGYNYLYVVTRILNEFRPLRILDVGLGISSTLISRYFEELDNPSGEHIIVEHDEEWKEFYCKTRKLSDQSTIVMKSTTDERIGMESCLGYIDFSTNLQNKRFNLISVDGPGCGPKYSRRDILKLLPNVLDEQWIIIFDDYNNRGVKRTVNETKRILANKGYAFCCGKYSGLSDVYVMASEANRYYCSL